MFDNIFILLGISTLCAAIPVGVWLFFLLKKSERSKKTIFFIFFLGCFTAPFLLGIQELWSIFPNFDLASFIERSVKTPTLMWVATFFLFAALEEITKMYVVVQVDKRTLLINKINDALKYSMASALGFSFIENVYYLYQFWPSISTGQLVGMYIFRSIFTTCAHLMFSGIFGYFYGVSKFSIDIAKQKTITQKSGIFTRTIAYIFDLPMSQAYQQKLVFTGLSMAILIHAVYNYLLQYNIVLPAILFVILGFLYLQYLLKRKAGHLILSTDISEQSRLSMAKRDEDVVVELLDMWLSDKRYADVIQVCERLLERDPNNNVVKLFKAKAMDKMEDNNIYKSILSKVVKDQSELNNEDRSVINKYIEQKEKINKEQKTKSPMPTPAQQQTPNTPSKDYLDNFTEGDSFKL